MPVWWSVKVRVNSYKQETDFIFSPPFLSAVSLSLPQVPRAGLRLRPLLLPRPPLAAPLAEPPAHEPPLHPDHEPEECGEQGARRAAQPPRALNPRPLPRLLAVGRPGRRGLLGRRVCGQWPAERRWASAAVYCGVGSQEIRHWSTYHQGHCQGHVLFSCCSFVVRFRTRVLGSTCVCLSYKKLFFFFVILWGSEL